MTTARALNGAEISSPGELAVEALRLSEERHRIAVEVAEMGTWIWRIESDELTWSERFKALFGLPVNAGRDEVVQRIHADDRDRLDEALRETVGRGAPLSIEYRVVWPDGTIHWIASKGRMHRSAAGTPLDLQGIIMDITERKRAQEALQQRESLERRSAELKRSNDELQQFAYVAAHDLQEPLRMIASYTQLLAQRYQGRLDADADEFIGFAVDGAHRLQRLIADLLAYCRVGTAETTIGTVSSTEALEQAMQNLDGAMLEAGAIVTHDALPTIIADQVQLVQLFQNLVGNSIKYRGAEPPRIHVSVRNTGGEWIFAVEDNGIGIDPQYFDKIFVMFQRLHRREAYPGTGIGLSLCKKIVERHGGRIWVESAPGKGSSFFFALPRGEAK